MQVTVLDRPNTAYTVRQLFKDVKDQLSAERCIVAPGSCLTLEGMQAEEGLPRKLMASRVGLHRVKNAMLLLGFAGAAIKLDGFTHCIRLLGV